MSFINLIIEFVFIILFMQAIILSSRSISQNHCFQRQTEQKYKKHMQTIRTIGSQKMINIADYQAQVDYLSTQHKKSKSVARLFHKKQQKQSMKHDNINLIKKIWNKQPIVQTFNNDEKYQYVSGSNLTYNKRRLQEIKNQNKRMGMRVFMQQYFQKKDFKHKLKEEIKEYIERRDQIRKLKKKDQNGKRSISQKKPNKEQEKIKQSKKSTELQDPQKNQNNQKLPSIESKLKFQIIYP